MLPHPEEQSYPFEFTTKIADGKARWALAPGSEFLYKTKMIPTFET
jgi:hypothetical protein